MKTPKFMKSVFSLLIVLAAFGLTSVQAQPPTYALPQGTSNNIFPFGSATSNCVQWLYTPSDFVVQPVTGNITRVYFKTWSGASSYTATYTNLTIKMGLTTATSFTSGAWVTGLTTVYTAASVTVPTTSSLSWFSFNLTTPFPYTFGSNLIVEISHTGISGSITANCTVGSNRRIYGATGSSSGTLGANMGDIGLDISTGPPCPAPTGFAASNVLSTSTDLSWSPVTGSIGYEYLVDQNPTPVFPWTVTSTTTTSAMETGLTPSTTYYAHLRNQCSEFNFSPWVDISFTTLPPCEPPIGFKTANLEPTSTDIEWDPWPSALSYDYVVDQDRNDPSPGTGVGNTLVPSANLTGLTEDTWYYVHIRSRCAGGVISDWSLDSFQTPVPCRPPNVEFDHIQTMQAVLYWDPVASADFYEYVLNQNPTPPDFGTKYDYTSLHASALNPNQQYYFHIRSFCTSVGVKSNSEWKTYPFRTRSVSVEDISGMQKGYFEVYPNPTRGLVKIALSQNPHPGDQIQVMDLMGRVLHTQGVQSSPVDLDLSGWTPGMYWIRYSGSQGSAQKSLRLE